MPESYLHRRLALGIVGQMDGRAANFVHAAPALYEVGALGPDPLFAHHYMRPLSYDAVRELGSRLHHERTGAFLGGLLREAARGGPALRAYALGFLCHYAADSTIHPYVYAVTGEHGDRPRAGSHGFLECAVDGWFYSQDFPDARPPIPPPAAALLAMTQAERLEVGRAIAAAARASHGSAASAEDVAGAFADMARLSRLQYSPRGGKYALAAVLERLAGRTGALTGHFVRRRPPQDNGMNAAAQPWATPWEPERSRRETVQELYESASRLALACVEAAARFFLGECGLEATMAVVGNRNMASGLDSGA